MSALLSHPGSYRDPSGFVFEKEGIFYRQVNCINKDHFDHFINSGCYAHFVENEWLIPHEEISLALEEDTARYKILRPEQVPVISYPAEWSFGMIKDAALLTLKLAIESLRYDMILKDATPLNIQWHKGKLIFIDTLSFEKYENHPWIAYRQFCENFLGPLLLMHYKKLQLPQLYNGWPEGIPITTISSLLPARSKLSVSVYLHIHLNAKYAVKKNAATNSPPALSKTKMLTLLDNLQRLVTRLRAPARVTNWSNYYEEAAGRKDYLEQKEKIIAEWTMLLTGIATATDLGANEGTFSQLLAREKIQVLATDLDVQCIDHLYERIKATGEKYVQPLVIDLSNPTPATGVNNSERTAFIPRGKADLVLALAIIHHLFIGKNISFAVIGKLCSALGEYLIIEFVPKEDAMVKLMLSSKKDVYPGYTETSFAEAFSVFFSVMKKEPIPGTGRILYLFKNRQLQHGDTKNNTG